MYVIIQGFLDWIYLEIGFHYFQSKISHPELHFDRQIMISITNASHLI